MRRKPLSFSGMISCLLLALSGVGQAQHPWEFTPRTGEQRFNKSVYKASHNSYEQSLPLYQQVDDYNAWCLELDIWWFNDNSDGSGLRVSHTSPTVSNATLAEKLVEMTLSQTKESRFTVLMVEMKEGLAFPWPDRDTYRTRIKNVCEAVLGADRIYTMAMFDDPNGDDGKWPSYQELVRRGKHFAIVLQEPNRNETSDYFFTVHHQNPMPGNNAFDIPYKIVYNNGNASDTPSGQGDRYLSRTYPAGTEGTCLLQEASDFWNRGVAAGYNFTATNCVHKDYTVTDARTHSPAPLFVAHGNTDVSQLGTLGFPYWGANGLLDAFQRVSTMVEVSIESGTYDLPNGTRINRPMVLKSRNGNAILR